MQNSHALRADLELQRDRLQDQCDQQSAQILALRTQLDESQAALTAERERQEAHIRAAENRAHREVDRARQEAKQWQQRHEVAERTNRDALAATQGRHDAAVAQVRHLEQEFARQTGQIGALEKALSEAYSAASKQKSANKASKANKVSAKRVLSKRSRPSARLPK